MTSRLPSFATAALVSTTTAVILSCATMAGAGDAYAGSSKSTLVGGVFTPGLPAAANFGPDDSRKCPRGGPFAALVDAIDDQKSTAPKPLPDGRLCALAETMIDWDDKKPVPGDLSAFLGNHFGLVTAPLLTVAVTDTDRSRDLGERLVGSVMEYAGKATQPRFGLATQRLSGKNVARGEVSQASTKLVLVLWDAVLEHDPLPRKLAAGQAATFSGKLGAALTNPKIDVGNVDGKLESPAQQPGQAFKADLHCGDKAGEIHAELRAEANGAPRLITNLTVYCGMEPPASVTLAPEFNGQLDASAEEKKIFDLINQERQGLGIAPLQYDAGIATAARKLAELAASDLRRGVAPGQVDVIKLLKENDVVSSLITVNPVGAPSPADAHRRLRISPFGRSQYLNAAVSHVGLGLAGYTDPNGINAVVLDEVFVKEQPPHDLVKLREELQGGVSRKRGDARAGALEVDPAIQEVAQKYAEALAASKNNLPKEQDDALLAPLRQSLASINIVAGAPKEPLEFAEEPGVIAPGKLMGLGVAEGVHPLLGKGTAYVVLIIGAKHEAAAPAKAKGKGKRK